MAWLDQLGLSLLQPKFDELGVENMDMLYLVDDEIKGELRSTVQATKLPKIKFKQLVSKLDEVLNMVEMFQNLDADSNGQLDHFELTKLCAQACLTTEEQIKKAVAEMEGSAGNGDGHVSFSEFMNW